MCVKKQSPRAYVILGNCLPFPGINSSAVYYVLVLGVFFFNLRLLVMFFKPFSIFKYFKQKKSEFWSPYVYLFMLFWQLLSFCSGARAGVGGWWHYWTRGDILGYPWSPPSHPQHDYSRRLVGWNSTQQLWPWQHSPQGCKWSCQVLSGERNGVDS